MLMETIQAVLSFEAYHTTEALTIVEVLAVTQTCSNSIWVMDSGCSFHMTHMRDWFTSFEHKNCGFVLLGNVIID